MTQIDRINGLVGSIAVKAPCVAATTTNITLSGAQTIDGISIVSGDRCLVKNQITASDNGIYDVSGTDWSRAIDFNGLRDIVQGTCVRIISGTVSGQYFYEVTTEDPAIGTTDIAFALVNFPNTTSAYISTLLDDETALAARSTLVAAGTTDNNSFSGANTFSGVNTFQKTTYLKKGADIASANDLTLLADGNSSDITGTTTVNGMTDGILNETRHFHADAAFILKHNTAASSGFSSMYIVQGAADITTEAGDEWDAIYDGTVWRIFNYNKAAISPLIYEEGTWSPVLSDGTNSDATQSIAVGHYEKIGRQITARFYLAITSLGAISGSLRVTGLPYSSTLDTNAVGSAYPGSASNMALTAGTSLSGYVFSNRSYINLFAWDHINGTSALQSGEFTAAGSLIMTAVYHAQ
jgi:hypothetical protein